MIWAPVQVDYDLVAVLVEGGYTVFGASPGGRSTEFDIEVVHVVGGARFADSGRGWPLSGDRRHASTRAMRVVAQVPRIAEKLWPLIAETRPKTVVLDPSGVVDLEYSALKMLTEGEKRQREASVMLWLSTRGILRRTGTGPTSVVYYWRVSDPMGLTARV